MSFDPPLYIQRRARVLRFLKRPTPPISTLLDLGTCDGEFLRYLTRCDDDIPLTKLSGLDIDIHSLSEFNPPEPHPEDRWRELEIELLYGDLLDIHGSWDAVSAIEVIEHLPPPAFDKFAQSILGRLCPRICIVTTPNRDFNVAFGEEFGFDVGLPYRVRHEDHKFEMTRPEFVNWANVAAKEFGYDLILDGVGTYEEMSPGGPAMDNIGFCTQMAVFERLESKVSRILHIEIPYLKDDEYPPTTEKVQQLLVEAEKTMTPRRGSGDWKEIVVSMDEIWQSYYPLRRAFRFHEDEWIEAFKAIDSIPIVSNGTIEEEEYAQLLKIDVMMDEMSLRYTFDTSEIDYESDRSYD